MCRWVPRSETEKKNLLSLRIAKTPDLRLEFYDRLGTVLCRRFKDRSDASFVAEHRDFFRHIEAPGDLDSGFHQLKKR